MPFQDPPQLPPEPIQPLTKWDTPEWVSLVNANQPKIESEDHPWGVVPPEPVELPAVPPSTAPPSTQVPTAIPQVAKPTPTQPASTAPADPNLARSQTLDKQLSDTGSVTKVKNSRQGIGRQESLSNLHAASVLEYQDLTRQAEAKVAAAKSEAESKTLDATNQALDAYDRDRAMARQRAATGLRESQARTDMLARSEPNPGRLWSNMSGWGKASFVLGTMASALATNRTNPTATLPIMQQFMQMVKDDVASQRETTERLLTNEKAKRQDILSTRGDELDAAREVHEGVLTRLSAADKYLQGLAAQAGGNERRLAGIAQARATLAAAAADTNSKWLTTVTNREDKAADRAHAERMAQIQFDNQRRLKEIEQQAERDKNNRQVSPELGLSIITGRDAKGNPIMKTMDAVDEKGNPIKKPMTVLEKDVLPKATEMVATAQRVHDAMGRAIRKLETMTNKDVLLNEDPEFNQDMQLVGRYLATDKTFNEGRTSDADVRSGDRTAAGLGQGGLASSLANLLDRRDMTLAALQHYRNGMTSVVNKSLQQFPTPEGGSLHWTPIQSDAEPADTSKYNVPGEAEQKLAQSQDAAAGIPFQTDPSIPALEAGGFRNPEPKGRYTPVTKLQPIQPEEAQALDSLSPALKGATPSTIRTTINGAKTPDGEPVSRDARERYFRTQDAALNEAEQKQTQAANALVRFLSSEAEDGKLPDPTNAQIREFMVASGFAPGKLRPEDYQVMRDIVEQTWNKGTTGGFAGIRDRDQYGFTPEDYQALQMTPEEFAKLNKTRFGN